MTLLELFDYLNKRKSPYPGMIHARYQCILAIGSWKEDYWRFIKIVLIWPQNGPAPLFEQIWIPIPQAHFLPSLLEIGIVILEKKLFEGKIWRRMDDGCCAMG